MAVKGYRSREFSFPSFHPQIEFRYFFPVIEPSCLQQFFYLFPSLHSMRIAEPTRTILRTKMTSSLVLVTQLRQRMTPWATAEHNFDLLFTDSCKAFGPDEIPRCLEISAYSLINAPLIIMQFIISSSARLPLVAKNVAHWGI